MSSINPTGRGGSIQLNTGTTSVRSAPKNDFGTHMRSGIATGAGAASQAISVAAPYVPGAAVVSAAVSGAGQSMAGGGGLGGGAQTAGFNAGGGGGAVGGSFASTGDIPGLGPSTSTAGLGGGGGAAGGGGSAQQNMIDATAKLQEMSQSFNLQYLQLQEKTQSENRSFTTVSNVMKTKHDTAKSSINNVR